MTEKLKQSKPVVTRLEETWPNTGSDKRDLVLPEGDARISQMAQPRRWTPEELRARKLIHVNMKEREALNAFRQLRTQLIQRSQGENFAVLMVSTGGGESSAALDAINLAAAIALDPQKTALYVDCNPYRPSAHRYMLEKPQHGITDLLDDPEIPVEDIVYPSGVDRLRVIPVGSEAMSAAEQFYSSRMQALIHELKQRYSDRYIVVHAPSATSSSEAQALSQYCDHTVLVAPYGETTPTDIMAASQAIDSNRLAGMVYSYL